MQKLTRWSAPNFEAAADADNDNVYDITVTASDGDGGDSKITEHAVAITVTDEYDEISLALLDGSNGFTLTGIDSFDYSGASVSSAGDVNGDGYDDLIIGARFADPNGEGSGETYVVYGGASAPGTDGVLALSALDGTNGFTLTGIDSGDRSGVSVSSAGDVNGDGYDDLIIGARLGPTRMGRVRAKTYVVYGGANAPGTDGVLALSALDGKSGFTLTGIDSGDYSGFSVSSAGDVNGDGYGDLIIGADRGNRVDPNGEGSGETYVVYGGANAPGTDGVLALSALDGKSGFTLTGIDSGDYSGFSVSSAGDVNGDGYGDLIIGADRGNRVDPNGEVSGETHVVYGGASAPGADGVLDLSALDGSSGFTLSGIDPGDVSGYSVSSAGDVNGDGYDDLIIGARGADPNGGSSGETYVVYGGASAPGTDGVLDLSALDGTNGFTLTGIDPDDESGRSVSSAGDVNGDGYDDLIIGASRADPNGHASGETHVVYGGARAPGTDGVLALSALDGTNGYTLTGSDPDGVFDASVSSAGDVNGDGYDDLIIGARGANPNGARSGETYVVYGGASTPGTDGVLDLSALDGASGFTLTGIDPGDVSGYSVSSAGDVNGDGYDDLIIGADGADSDAGETHVVYGGRAPGTNGVLALSALDGTNGFIVSGSDPDDESGASVSSAGDVNGDGYDDLIIGARGADPGQTRGAGPGGVRSGETHVVYGAASAPGTDGVLALSALDGANGFTLKGIERFDFGAGIVCPSSPRDRMRFLVQEVSQS